MKQNSVFRFGRNSDSAGFSLIELMVALVIIAIIAAIAYPSYLKEVRDSRRTTAITNLLNIQSQVEKYYSTNNAYPASLTYLGYSANTYDVPSGSSPFYGISYGVNTSGFNLTATPMGDQMKDTDCGKFKLNYLGVKSVTGFLAANPSKCWGQ